MRRWVSSFYSNIESTIVKKAVIERTCLNRPKGYVRAVVSPLTFIFYQPNCLQIKSFTNKPVKGINIFGDEIKLSQFVDNLLLPYPTAIWFNANLGSFDRSLKILEDFAKLAGLFLNVKKTKAI